jgi:hypothetical protein
MPPCRAFWWLPDEEATRAKVAFYSGCSAGSGGFNNALGKLRSAGLVEGWRITPAGEASIPPDVGPKPVGSELREWLRPKLGRAENAILDVLVAARGEPLTNAQIGDPSGYRSAAAASTTPSASSARLRPPLATNAWAVHGPMRRCLFDP